MADVLREFLVKLNFFVDTSSAQKATGTADNVAKAVTDADRKITDTQIVGSGKRIIQANREAGIRTKGAAQLIAETRRTAEADAQHTKAIVGTAKEREHVETEAARAAQARSTAFVTSLTAMVAGAAYAATKITAAVVDIAGGMEKLAYSGVRTASSVGNLKAFGYAASQLGSSAEEAIGFVETLSKKMREAPGYEGMLKGMGINTRDENDNLKERVQLAEELQTFLTSMPPHMQIAYANAMEMPDKLMLALTSGKFSAEATESRDMMKAAGLDSDKAAKDSVEFMNVWRKMQAGIEIITTRIEGALVKRFGSGVSKFTDWLIKNSDRIADAFVKIGEVVGNFVTRIGDLFAAFDKLSPSAKDMLTKLGALAGAILLFGLGPLGAMVAITAAIVAFLDEAHLRKLGEMWDKFDALTKRLVGQDGITVAFEALAAVLATRVVVQLAKVLGLVRTLGGTTLAPWLIGMLGIGGTATVAAAVGTAIGADAATPNKEKPALSNHWDDEASGATGGAGTWDAAKRAWRGVKNALSPAPDDQRSFSERLLPKALGGKDAPEAPSRPLGKISRNENAAAIMDELRQGGYNNNAIAATVGSMQTESSFNPRARNNVTGGHTGLWQWDSTRWPKIAGWIKSQGGDPYDARWQTKAWMAEHNAKKGDALYDTGRTAEGGRILRSNPNLEDAIHGVRESERFGAGEEGGRAANARKWLPIIEKPATPVTAPPATIQIAPTVIPKIEGALQNFNDRFSDSMGAADRLRAPTAPIIGGSSSTSSNTTTNSLAPVNNFTINGARDPASTGKEVERAQSRVHADLLRNLQGAIA